MSSTAYLVKRGSFIDSAWKSEELARKRCDKLNWNLTPYMVTQYTVEGHDESISK